MCKCSELAARAEAAESEVERLRSRTDCSGREVDLTDPNDACQSARVHAARAERAEDALRQAEAAAESAYKRAEQAERERDEARAARAFDVEMHENVRDQADERVRWAKRDRDIASAKVTKAERQLAEVTSQAAAMRELLPQLVERFGHFTWAKRNQDGPCAAGCLVCAVEAALAPDAGRALAAELAAHRARATGLCSAHQVANDPSCRLCYPATRAEVAALREVAVAAQRYRTIPTDLGDEAEAAYHEMLAKLDALQAVPR